jgi:hypothetical protein
VVCPPDSSAAGWVSGVVILGLVASLRRGLEWCSGTTELSQSQLLWKPESDLELLSGFPSTMWPLLVLPFHDAVSSSAELSWCRHHAREPSELRAKETPFLYEAGPAHVFHYTNKWSNASVVTLTENQGHHFTVVHSTGNYPEVWLQQIRSYLLRHPGNVVDSGYVATESHLDLMTFSGQVGERHMRRALVCVSERLNVVGTHTYTQLMLSCYSW